VHFASTHAVLRSLSTPYLPALATGIDLAVKDRTAALPLASEGRTVVEMDRLASFILYAATTAYY